MQQTTRVKLNNPKILEWARDESKISIQEVANKFKKSKFTIEAWEQGSEAPTFRQLIELANYYKRPVPLFFVPVIPKGTPKPDDYRALPNVIPGDFSKQTLLAYRDVFNMLLETRELLNELGSNITFSLPTWTIENDIDQKAEQFRSMLGISIEKQIEEFDTYYTAQDAWRNVLFNHGVIVRICKMPISDARAFCLFGDNLAGIGLSNEDKAHGRIFSLFHEVCHLSIKKPGVSGITSRYQASHQHIEQYCDSFSASFLLPSSHPEVIESLGLFKGTIDLLEVARFIANKFKVSKYVAIRRAFDLDVISPDIYWDTITEWRKIDRRIKKPKSSGGNYPATQISYIGKRLIELVMEAFRRNYYTPIEVRRMVGLDPVSIERNL